MNFEIVTNIKPTAEIFMSDKNTYLLIKITLIRERERSLLFLQKKPASHRCFYLHLYLCTVYSVIYLSQ